jgi:IS5 family transposase
MGWTPKRAVLQKTISAITAASWEAINQAVVQSARQTRLEPAAMVRIDSTVTEALMHAPTDSSLLWDAVRVMARLLEQAAALAGPAAIDWRDHRRLAKKRAHAIQHSRGKERKAKLYRELLAATRATKLALERALVVLTACAGPAAAEWCGEVRHYLPLIERVMTQTRRRVFDGEAVPASEKLVSLFEPHADIIVKGGRDVQYGHKINLASGRSGLILDVVVETGNPADAERFLPMLERHIALHGQPPRQIASDGGYASAANLTQAKALGVSDVAFHKKCRLDIEAMVKSRWVYRKLRNFRAGIEANISCLKRAFGLARCTWRGLAHFAAYVWSSVVSYNLALCARLALAET